jgi:hypothetical protein
VNSASPPFELRTALHLLRPTGRHARNLEELRTGLAEAPDASLFQHAVQHQLRHRGVEHEPTDDLSAWIAGAVQDRETAERCAFVVQTRNGSPAELRAALASLLDSVPAEARLARDAPEGGEFVFLASETIVLETGAVAHDAFELLDLLVRAEPGVRFYHLVEDPWYHAGESALAAWLAGIGEARLARAVRQRIDEQHPLERRGRRILAVLRAALVARRVSHADGGRMPLAGGGEREAASRLVHRITRPRDEP